MEKSDTGLYQVEYQRGKPVRKGRFDIVIGSAVRARAISAGTRTVMVTPIFYSGSAVVQQPGYYADRPMFTAVPMLPGMSQHLF